MIPIFGRSALLDSYLQKKTNLEDGCMTRKLLTLFLLIVTTSLFGEQSMLYIIHAKQGRYENEMLQLKSVSERVTYFTKAPHRRAGILELDQFLPQLKSEKEVKGHLVFHQETKEPFHDILMTLSDPKMSGDQLTAKVVAVPPAKIPEKKRLESVTLLFDLPNK